MYSILLLCFLCPYSSSSMSSSSSSSSSFPSPSSLTLFLSSHFIALLILASAERVDLEGVYPPFPPFFPSSSLSPLLSFSSNSLTPWIPSSASFAAFASILYWRLIPLLIRASIERLGLCLGALGWIWCRPSGVCVSEGGRMRCPDCLGFLLFSC